MKFRFFMLVWIPIMLILNVFVIGMAFTNEPKTPWQSYRGSTRPIGDRFTNIIIFNLFLICFSLFLWWCWRESERIEKSIKGKSR